VHVGLWAFLGLKTHTKNRCWWSQGKGKTPCVATAHRTANYQLQNFGLYTNIGPASGPSGNSGPGPGGNGSITSKAFSKQQSFRRLLVAPVTLRKGDGGPIERWIGHPGAAGWADQAKNGNSLVDPGIICPLYESLQAGVQIDLLISVACVLLRPGGWPVSATNIRVQSHHRPLSLKPTPGLSGFGQNNGEPEDLLRQLPSWMPRNLDRRSRAVAGRWMIPAQGPAGALLLEGYFRRQLRRPGGHLQGSDGQGFQKNNGQKPEGGAATSGPARFSGSRNWPGEGAPWLKPDQGPWAAIGGLVFPRGRFSSWF